tara:strand:- start:127 stop:1074 length:948 start_codon:yes stop_codon:yes gene_type:complete
MFSISLWSLSNHLQNKVLPSIKGNKKIKVNSILTKKKGKGKIDIKNIKYFFNKNDFLKNNQSHFVYISSINSEHYKNCLDALKNKKNVICEKPICLTIKQLSKLKKIAKKNNVKIFEMIQYVEHPVFNKIHNIIKNKKLGKILFVESAFKVPLYENKGFRFNKRKGGGALYDSGFYPISLLYTLFQSKKIKLENYNIVYEKGIDIYGNLFCHNDRGIYFDLSWGFKSNYQNYVNILCEKASINVNFIFSKKISQNAIIKIRGQKNNNIIKIKKSNQINMAFNKYLTSTENYHNRKLEESSKILKILEKINQHSMK